MLVPIYLGLCRDASGAEGHEAASVLAGSNLETAMLVAVAHAVAMIAAGGALAWSVYRYLGLKFVSRSWLNLETSWAVSFIVVGTVATALSLAS
jgi:hypothetical protein